MFFLWLSVSFFHPIGELFKDNEVRAVFLVNEEQLFLSELEYLQLKSGLDVETTESKTNLSMEETGDLPQDLPVFSKEEIEEYLTSQYSQSNEPEIQLDPEILSRFTLDRVEKEGFSLVYDPGSFKNLEKDPQEVVQRKRPVGLLSSYGLNTQYRLAGGRNPKSSEGTSPQPLGQTSVRFLTKDLAPWADKVLEKIERNWIIDPRQPQGIKGTVRISVTFTKSGEMINVEVIKSSGDQVLDDSAVNAIERSLPLPGLPMMYPSKSLVFTIEFEYDF